MRRQQTRATALAKSHGSPIEFLPIFATYFKCVRCRPNCSLCSTLLWFKYGYILGDAAMTVVNGFGMLLSMLSLAVYYQNTGYKRVTELQGILGLTVVAAWLVAIARGWLTLDGVGLSAMSGSVVMYAMPLVSLVRALRQVAGAVICPASVSLEMVTVALLVSLAWVAYGACIHDRYVLIPNALGFVLSVCQLGLWGLQRTLRHRQAAQPCKSGAQDPLLLQRTIELRKL